MIISFDQFRTEQCPSTPEPPLDMNWMVVLITSGKCRRYICPKCRKLWYLKDKYV